IQQPDGTQPDVKLGKERTAAFEKCNNLHAAGGGRVRQENPPVADPPAMGDNLTPREREVLALIASGKATKEIAYQLGISFRTAMCHRSRILSKLDANNSADLTRAAIRMRLIHS